MSQLTDDVKKTSCKCPAFPGSGMCICTVIFFLGFLVGPCICDVFFPELSCRPVYPYSLFFFWASVRLRNLCCPIFFPGLSAGPCIRTVLFFFWTFLGLKKIAKLTKCKEMKKWNKKKILQQTICTNLTILFNLLFSCQNWKDRATNEPVAQIWYKYATGLLVAQISQVCATKLISYTNPIEICNWFA